MQSKPELSSNAIQQNFLANSENTMNAELGANVGLVLLRLARHFSNTPSNQAFDWSQPIISSEKIEAYLLALSEQVAQQENAVQEAWSHVKKN